MIAVLPALVALISAFFAVVYYFRVLALSRSIADRTVTIEAQKLLLEINKRFISDPNLLAIYDDHPKRDELIQADARLNDKIRALGFMKLNVFELVFAIHPDGVENNAWVAYFRDSLSRCSVLQEEFKLSPGIYHSKLVAQYEEWRSSRMLANGPTPP